MFHSQIIRISTFADEYSGHSLRRGFANWANSSGWDIKTLMKYVGWKDVQSALRYAASADPFAKMKQIPAPVSNNQKSIGE